MRRRAGLSRLAVVFVAASGLLVPSAAAQMTSEAFITGDAARAYEKWQVAMKAELARDRDLIEFAFGEVLATDPSPMRIALFAERSVKRNENAGGVLLFEQDYQAGALGENGRAIAELLETGRELLNQADDGWYFASVGRFDVAAANFSALLEASPDPVALLEFAERVPRRHEILAQLADHPTVGEPVRRIMKLLEKGEQAIKADPTRIRQNLERLDGPPRAFENGVAKLSESGEYSVPIAVQYLREADKRQLAPAIIRALPLIGRNGLNPLVMALEMDDQAVKRIVIETLGRIGYSQSIPYLLKLREAEDTPVEIKSAVDAALADLGGRGVRLDSSAAPAQAFLGLAEAYYYNHESLAADSRLDTANVWYWRDDLLQNVAVPTAIFNEIMCMRCCEEALRLDPALKPAISLWLAANFHRAAQLAEGETDYTRPEGFPSAAYFAQSAGAEHCLRALARAVDDSDSVVALGAIEALRKTAGPASLSSAELGRLPLAECLSSGDRLVRIRAAIALGLARPQQAFENSQNLIPVLNEALMLFGGVSNALVVDADSDTANAAAGRLRELGFATIVDATLFAGLQKVRNESPGVDVIVLASDLASPEVGAAIRELRGEFRFRATPILIAAKRGQADAAADVARADERLVDVAANADVDGWKLALARAMKAAGATAITPEVGASLSLEAAGVLQLLAVTRSPVFDVGRSQAALIEVLNRSDDPALRTTAAGVLSYIPTSESQEALAAIALSPEADEAMRVAMFSALAEAAKHHGNKLGSETVAAVIEVVESDASMTLREAASRALGALDLKSDPASELIRGQYAG